MKTVTLNNAISDLPQIIASILRDQDETVIATDNGSVVMVDQESWDGMHETLRLLKDKKALKALLEGHSLRDKNKPKGKPSEEFFNDLNPQG